MSSKLSLNQFCCLLSCVSQLFSCQLLGLIHYLYLYNCKFTWIVLCKFVVIFGSRHKLIATCIVIVFLLRAVDSIIIVFTPECISIWITIIIDWVILLHCALGLAIATEIIVVKIWHDIFICSIFTSIVYISQLWVISI